MKNYKFRAECLFDFLRLLEMLSGINYSIQSSCMVSYKGAYSNIEIELSVDLSLEELMKIMPQVTGGHRMWQTVNTREYYTGEIVRGG